MQGHRSAKPHTSCPVPLCHMFAVIIAVNLLTLNTLAMHRSRVLVRRVFSLLAYTRVTNFCHIFSHGHGGRLIRGTAYTRLYTLCASAFLDLLTALLVLNADSNLNCLCLLTPLITAFRFVSHAPYNAAAAARQMWVQQTPKCI